MNLNRENKILVTGGTGHLGAAIVHYLVNKVGIPASNVSVFYLTGSPNKSLANIEGLNTIEGNVLNRSDVEKAVRGAEYVFHTIGSTTFNPALKKIQWQINVEGTRNIMESCLNEPSFIRLCHTGTVNVLAPPASVLRPGNEENCNPYSSNKKIHSFVNREHTLQCIERFQLHPDEIAKNTGIGYYDSKLAAQELFRKYTSQLGLEAVSVLPGTMFGPYDHLVGTGQYLLSVFKNEMPIVLKTAGFPLAHVMDVARGHILATEKGLSGEEYIMAGHEEDNLSMMQMATIIAEELSVRYPDKHIRAPFFEVPYTVALGAAFIAEKINAALGQQATLTTDAVRAARYPLFYESKKAVKELEYVPEFRFREAVQHMIQYYSAHHLFESNGRWMDDYYSNKQFT